MPGIQRAPFSPFSSSTPLQNPGDQQSDTKGNLFHGGKTNKQKNHKAASEKSQAGIYLIFPD